MRRSSPSTSIPSPEKIKLVILTSAQTITLQFNLDLNLCRSQFPQFKFLLSPQSLLFRCIILFPREKDQILFKNMLDVTLF